MLRPDHDAKTLRALMDQFNEVATAPRKKQLTESTEAGVAEGVNYTDELRDKMQWLMTTHHMRSGEAEEAAYYDQDPATWKGSPWEDEYTGVSEARPDVMRHRGDTTIRVVKRAGKPIGEIGIDSEASEGNGQYYVKLYDGSYDAVGFDSAEEALAELKAAIKQGVAEGSDNLAIGQQMARDGIKYDPAQEGEIISQIGDYLKRSGMTPRQIRGYMIDNDFVSDQLSYLPRKSELAEFAPSDSGGDDGDDGFDEDTLRQLAAKWFNGDEDPAVERTLMAAGWEIGQDEGYADEPGVFVVMSGDEHGKTYMSWSAEELRSDVAEATMSRAAKGYEKYGKEGMAALAKAGREGKDLDKIRDKYNRYDESAESDVTEGIDPIEQLRADILRFSR